MALACASLISGSYSCFYHDQSCINVYVHHIPPACRVDQLTETIVMDGFSASVKRTQRKRSVGFRVVDGQVLVLAPQAISNAELGLMLAAKQTWVLTKLASQSERQPLPVRHYVNGEGFACLDDAVQLDVRPGAFKACVLDAHNLIVTVPQAKPEWVRNALERWYRQQAQEHLEARVAHFAPLVGAWPTAIQIKTYRARWGSCNHQGQVQFNWKIMMAPSAVVDSVVVHELCHLLHMHHGPAFWAQVRRVLPNYRDAKQWLKQEGYRLTLD
ncbi:MAG TPA: M48 family peptidase [Oceanospirillaceae bacterium]|nr:M48 family peptidase [Oceanospirillaceae bacterium]